MDRIGDGDKLDYQYSAYICYCHEDNKQAGRKWATWLQNKLEELELPEELHEAARLNPESPTGKLHKLFRDETDLGPARDLPEALKKVLKASKFLLVLCSPRAARSGWVGKEISYFRELGRNDRIICAVIDGDPDLARYDKGAHISPNSLNTCYHPELLRSSSTEPTSDEADSLMPAGPDFRVARQGAESMKQVQGWTDRGADIVALRPCWGLGWAVPQPILNDRDAQRVREVAKIAASMLEVDPDSLLKREAKREIDRQAKAARAQRNRALATVTVMLLFVAVAIGWAVHTTTLLSRARAAEKKEQLARIDAEKNLERSQKAEAEAELNFQFARESGRIARERGRTALGLVPHLLIRLDTSLRGNLKAANGGPDALADEVAGAVIVDIAAEAAQYFSADPPSLWRSGLEQEHLSFLYSLVMLNREHGGLDEATQRLKEIVQERTEDLGANHPDVLVSRINLMWHLGESARYHALRHAQPEMVLQLSKQAIDVIGDRVDLLALDPAERVIYAECLYRVSRADEARAVVQTLSEREEVRNLDGIDLRVFRALSRELKVPILEVEDDPVDATPSATE